MASITPKGRDIASGEIKELTNADTLATKEGSPLQGGFPASYAFFDAVSISSTVIQWSKVSGTSDITVASGVVTLATAGVYEIISISTTSTSASTKDSIIRVPAGGSAVASATENQGTGGGSQTLLYQATFGASSTFDITLSAGFNANALENKLSVKRIA